MKYEWDSLLPDEIVNEWKRLKGDLELLPQIGFKRQALNEKESYGLNLFCDSSVQCYGFVAYASSETENKNYCIC